VVLNKLWEWAKEEVTQEELKNMFSTKDGYGRTAWHMASEKRQIEVLHKLWEWAKEVLTQEELKNMFLSKDEYGRTAWYMASEKGQIEVLQ
jgi:ankyrin repeat protein